MLQREVPLQSFIGRGGARKAVCAARGGGLIGAIKCRMFWLFDGSTISGMIAINPCMMFDFRNWWLPGGSLLLFIYRWLPVSSF